MNIAAQLSSQCAEKNHDLLHRNFISNAIYIKAARGVDLVRGAESGKKVVVAGAGPSLDAAIPALCNCGHTMIACDRAVRPLMAAGIVPDWIVTVEIQSMGAAKLRGLRGLGGVKLVFDPLCCPETVHEYPGPLYTYNKPSEVNGKGYLRQGTGVASFAVGLAEVLGASEIILTGVDLSYPERRIHAAGVVPVEGETFDGFMETPSVAGGAVLTDAYLVCNIQEISEAARQGLQIVQTSPNGAFIEHARHAALEASL